MGSVPLGLTINQFCLSKIILIPSVVSTLACCSFRIWRTFFASSFEHFILSFAVKDEGSSSTSWFSFLSVFES